MFKPIDGMDVVEDLRFRLLEKDTAIAELEMLMKFKDEKIKKLQLKKETLEEGTKELNTEVCKLKMEVLRLTTNQKNLLMALFVVLIAVLVAVLI